MPNKTAKTGSLVVFFGLIASGKSYLGARWAGTYGHPYYNTDVLRKECAGLAPSSRQGAAAFNEGMYGTEQTRRTYDELIRRACKDFACGTAKTVVLDGSYGDKGERQRVTAAFSARCDICFIYCWCSEATTVIRLDMRAGDPQAVSDGSLEIFWRQKEHFDPPEPIDGTRLLHLNTEEQIDALLKIVDDFVHGSTEYAGDE